MAIPKKAYERKDVRRLITLEARVCFDGNGILARINNISLGGACVTLPFPAAHYRPMVVSAINIEGLGYFAATCRWTSDFLIGLQFNNYATSAATVGNFLAALDAGEISTRTGARMAFGTDGSMHSRT